MRLVARVALVVLSTTGLSCSTSSSPPESTGYEARRQAFFDTTVAADPNNTYSEVVRVMRGIAPDESKIQHDLDRLTAREDTSDFKLPGLLWLLYKYSDSEVLEAELVANIKGVLLKHKFWPDERLNETEWLPEPEPVEGADWIPTTDSMVYVTENHYILYASGAYLVGQLYQDEMFEASGETGAEKMETFRPRVMKWLELRYKTGFSEWLSNVYYDEDIPAVVALAELAEDPEIKQLASMVLDLIFADLALNQYRGTFGSTHGRTYEQKFGGSRDSTRSTSALLFGVTDFDDPEVKPSNLPFELADFRPGNMSSTMVALAEEYRVPRVIYDIANDTEREEMENRQRMGIRLDEAESWGLDVNRFEDGMTFMTLEAYTHVLTFGVWVEMLDAYGWWVHDDYNLFIDFEDVLRNEMVRDAFAKGAEKDITRNMRPEVNIYTYRTPRYMLSTAQDYRDPHAVDYVQNDSGYGGDQQSIWQATLGKDAVVFTTHPANEDWGGDTPRFWTGYGTMPRSIQVKNVGISLYDIETGETIYVEDQPLYTHAFFDKSQFDEAYKEGGWFFGRYEDSYVALWASDPEADWTDNDDPDHQDLGDHEIVACPDGYPGPSTQYPDGYPGHSACQSRQGYGDCVNPSDCDKTIWISELGSAAEYADFDAFKQAILGAPLTVDVGALTVDYESPSQGRLRMGWNGEPLTQNGEPVEVHGYARYENPYSSSAFRDDVISFELAGRRLSLDYAQLKREYDYLLD
mgnify:CR=1 FL=1